VRIGAITIPMPVKTRASTMATTHGHRRRRREFVTARS
jgi:hypothetical protein